MSTCLIQIIVTVLGGNKLSVCILFAERFDEPTTPVIDIFGNAGCCVIDVFDNDTRIATSTGASRTRTFAAIDHLAHEDKIVFVTALPHFDRMTCPVLAPFRNQAIRSNGNILPPELIAQKDSDFVICVPNWDSEWNQNWIRVA